MKEFEKPDWSKNMDPFDCILIEIRMIDEIKGDSRTQMEKNLERAKLMMYRYCFL